MTYATADDMTARYGAAEMAHFEGAAISAALADAAAEMDASLGVRHTLPLDAATATAAAPVLRRLATQLTRYLLYVDDPPEAVAARASEARQTLRALAGGQVVLPGPDGATGPDYAQRTGPDPVMTATNLGGF